MGVGATGTQQCRGCDAPMPIDSDGTGVVRLLCAACEARCPTDLVEANLRAGRLAKAAAGNDPARMRLLVECERTAKACVEAVRTGARQQTAGAE